MASPELDWLGKPPNKRLLDALITSTGNFHDPHDMTTGESRNEDLIKNIVNFFPLKYELGKNMCLAV